MSLLYTTSTGPSWGTPLALGRGSARKRQSQTEKRPKLEFRGPLNSPVFRPFSTKSVLNSAWRPKLNKLGARDVEGLSRHGRHGRRELGGAAGGAHVLSTPVPESRRFDPFAKPQGNDRNSRDADGRSRRKGDIADCGRVGTPLLEKSAVKNAG